MSGTLDDIFATQKLGIVARMPDEVYTPDERVLDTFDYDKYRNVIQNRFTYWAFPATVSVQGVRTNIVTGNSIFLMDEMLTFSSRGAPEVFEMAIQFKKQVLTRAPETVMDPRGGIFEILASGDMHTLGILSDVEQHFCQRRFDPPVVIREPFDILFENNSADTHTFQLVLVGRVIPTKMNEYGQLDSLMNTRATY